MRKFYCLLRFLSVALLLLGISCVKDEMPVEPQPDNGAKQSHHITYEKALAELQSLMEYLDGQPLSRGGQPKRSIAGHYTKTFGAEATRSGDGEAPAVYVVNFEDGQGFAVLSVDDRMPPVFALAESGSLIEGDSIENPGVAIFMDNLGYMLMSGWIPPSDEIEDPDNPGQPYIFPNRTVYDPWTDYYTYGSVIPARWGQDYPYNDLCFTGSGSKAPAGCVATAVAQVMYFHRYPPVYYHDYGPPHYFNWTELIKHKYYNYGYSHPDDYPNAYDKIAELFLMLGRARNLNITYKSDGSGAIHTNIPRTFVNFGYSNGSHHRDYDLDIIKSSLYAKSPVLISGNRENIDLLIINIPYKGHTWVIDAVLKQSREVRHYLDDLLLKTYTEHRNLVHCNWGWSGDCNGYFYSGVFDTQSAVEYDYNYSMDYNYRYKVQILPYVHP